MADTDLLVVSRGGVQYKITRGELDAYLKDGYTVVDSMLFNGTNAQIQRLFSAGNLQTWTWSGWVKRGKLGTSQALLQTASSGGFGIGGFITFDTNDAIDFDFDYAGGTYWRLTTAQVFRDPSAWYHITVVANTTNATASDRLAIYINGERVTEFTKETYPSLNASGTLNTAYWHYTGKFNTGTSWLDGYLSEYNFIDGQALEPSAFGETGAFGEWLPKKYTGTYGTNGFYLEALDSADLGKDTSGNGNDWINTNVVQVTDTPTDNYATLNPLNSSSSSTLSNGNLDVISSTSAYNERTTIQLPLSGKWYFEATITQVDQFVGVLKGTVENNVLPSNTTDGWSFLCINGNKSNNVTQTAYASACSVGQTIGTAIDMDTGDLTFYRNGVSLGVAFTITDTSNLFFTIGQTTNASRQNVSNFGQTPFTYAPPTGFKALSTKNLPGATVVPSESFNTITYSGDAETSRAITGVGFQPDLTWIKMRSGTHSHNVIDSVRGATKAIFTNTNDQEYTYPNGLKSFDPDGFSVGDLADVNAINSTYVGWNWKAGTTVTNNDGTIESQVSTNPESGFSVVTFTTNNLVGATVGHGLGVAPSMIIMKYRGLDANWVVYHKDMSASPQNNYLNLNTTSSIGTSTDPWNNTAPTSSVITMGTGVGSASSTNYGLYTSVAYCFADVEGYSKFGTYQGNSNVNGTFVYTGFKPAFVLIKNVTQATDWMMFDDTRNPYNATDKYLQPNMGSAEASGIGEGVDLVSNGFKLRTTNPTVNGNTHIYMAFAEQPFKNANAR